MKSVIDQSLSPYRSICILVVATLGSLYTIGISPVASSAAEQETARRHSLIHRPTVETTSPSLSTGRTIQNRQIVAPPSLPTESPTLHRKLIVRPTPVSPAVSGTSTETARSTTVPINPVGQAVLSGTDSSKTAAASTSGTTAKPTNAPFTGLATTSSTALAPRSTAPTPLAATSIGTSGVNGFASAGGSGASILGGSRSALNLLRNGAIVGLLQPPTPTVTVPPPPAPPSDPPSSPPPVNPPPAATTGSATLSWSLNNESDLGGYKVYIGTASGLYTYPGSPITVGLVTTYTVTNLPGGNTYYFAISAYDSSGNESLRSTEVSKSFY